MTSPMTSCDRHTGETGKRHLAFGGHLRGNGVFVGTAPASEQLIGQAETGVAPGRQYDWRAVRTSSSSLDAAGSCDTWPRPRPGS